MTQCGLCQNYTLQFPMGFDADGAKYYREAGIGRCKLESIATVRSPTREHECKQYREAEEMGQRLEWMKRRKA